MLILVREIGRIMGRWSDRKFSLDGRTTKQLLQSNYEKLYLGPVFEFEKALANATLTVLICLTFAGQMPLLYFVAFVTLVV